MRLVITGSSGFVGSHLSEFILRQPRAEVFGFGREELADEKRLLARLRKIKPEGIFHLAAQSTVVAGIHSPAQTLSNNVFSELSILECIRKLGLKTKIVIAGSSEAYGQVEDRDLPIDEEVPYRPSNVYGVSKATQDLLAYQYFQSFKVQVIRVCAFNHIGPGQKPRIAAADFARQIAKIEKGYQDPVIRVGNLAAVRDFTDVRDMVRAYWLAFRNGVPGEKYNIGTGKGYSMRELLNMYLDLTDVKIKIQTDKSRFRPLDVPAYIADASKFKKLTGWKPEFKIRETLSDILDYWRKNVHGE